MNTKQEFRETLKKCSRIVGFSGAGVSTESGIADYRSQGGIWQQFQPVLRYRIRPWINRRISFSMNLSANFYRISSYR